MADTSHRRTHAILALAVLFALLAPQTALAAPGDNLLPNPSLETDSNADGVPDCWERDYPGAGDTDWTLVDNAHAGTVAQQVTVTGLEAGGDRKLLPARFAPGCAPAVIPGATYELSAWYTSTAADNALAVFLRSATTGEWSFWLNAGGFGATAAYTRAVTVTPPIPADADALTFGLGLYEDGTLVTDDYAMTQVTEGEPPVGPPVTEEVSIDGLNFPTAIEFLPNGTVLVAEKPGVVKAFDNLAGGNPRTILDIQGQVSSFEDFGLTALAYLDGYLYGNYTIDQPPFHDVCADYGQDTENRNPADVKGCPTTGRVARWPINANGVITGDEEEVIGGWDNFCFQFTTHGVDALEVHDGELYATAGEGAGFTVADYGQFGDNVCGDAPGAGGAFRSQTDTYLDGKAFHIDTGTFEPTVVAKGLRNPFRTTFHDGDLYISDTGWGQREEINKVTAPGQPGRAIENFGWPCYEGSLKAGGDYGAQEICQILPAGAVTPPAYEYEHNDFGLGSVTGVESLGDLIYFADATLGFIKAYDPATGAVTDVMHRTEDTLLTAVDLKETPGGGLVYVHLSDFSDTARYIENSGSIQSVIAGGSGKPPVGTKPTASISLRQSPYQAGERIEFGVEHNIRHETAITWSVTVVTAKGRRPLEFQGQGSTKGSFVGPNDAAPASVEVAVTVDDLTTGHSASDVETIARVGGGMDVRRLAGADRILTAVEVSRRSFPSGAGVAYVARADDFPDALAAGPLAARMGGPILLTGTAELAGATAEELRRVDPDRVVVLGGGAAVSEAVEAALAAEHGTVERLAGPSRYETAAAIAGELERSGGVGTVYVATGERFPDALVGGVAAGMTDGAVVLTGAVSLPEATSGLLGLLAPERIVLLGGEQAVSVDVEMALRAYGDVTRVFGPSRFETAVAVTESVFGTGTPRAFVATGADFPDALTVAPTAVAEGAALLLTERDSLPGVARAELGRLAPSQIVVVGGSAAVSDAVEARLRETPVP